jgi:hypothetical protein
LLIPAVVYAIALAKIFSIGVYLQHLGAGFLFSQGANTD